MEYLQQLSEAALSRLRDLNFDRRLIEELRTVAELPQDENKSKLIELRNVLELFFRDVARLAHEIDGVNFRGDWNSFASARDFLVQTGWMTRAEATFAASFYSLLSDIAAHPGVSKIEPRIATYVLWSLVNSVCYRVTNPYKRRQLGKKLDVVSQLRLAREFLRGIRSGRYKGTLFESGFNDELASLIREELRRDDVPMLWKMITDTSVKPNLRNRAASLLLSPRLTGNRAQRAEIINNMRNYYRSNKDTEHLLVLRAIALALSNKANDAECILDYISQIQQDSAILEGNLQTTDNYKGGVENAIEYGFNRINNPEVPTDGCVWEMFYISKRVKPYRKDSKEYRAILELLNRRLRITDSKELQLLCQKTIETIKRLSY